MTGWYVQEIFGEYMTYKRLIEIRTAIVIMQLKWMYHLMIMTINDWNFVYFDMKTPGISLNWI